MSPEESGEHWRAGKIVGKLRNLLRMNRIFKYNAGNLIGVEADEDLGDQSPEGMANHDVGRLNSGLHQSRVEFGCHLAR